MNDRAKQSPVSQNPKTQRLRDDLLALSNRRRVWDVCGQVLERYNRVETPHQYPELLPAREQS
jgi:hypothetical protein